MYTEELHGQMVIIYQHSWAFLPISLSFKGPTIATRAASKWGGVMIKLSGLSPCLLYSVFYFNSVVCRLQSVSY